MNENGQIISHVAFYPMHINMKLCSEAYNVTVAL